MKIAAMIAITALCVGCTLAKKEQKKPIPEYIKKMMSENKGKREAALSPYLYGAPSRSPTLFHSGGGSFNIGSGYSVGGPKIHIGSGNSLSSFPQSFSGSQPFLQLGPSLSLGGYKGSTSPRYTSISGLYKAQGSGGSNYPGHSLSSTAPQTFGHSISASQQQSSYAIPQFSSKPSFGFFSPSSSSSSGGHDSHIPSLPSYSATKGLGAFASSGHYSGISGLSGLSGLSSLSGHGSPSLSYGSPSSSYGVPSNSYGSPSSSYGVPSFGISHGGAPSGSYGVPSFGGSHGGLNSFSVGGIGGHNSFAGHGGSSSKNPFAGFFDTGAPTYSHSDTSHGLSSSYGAPSVSDFKPSVFLGSSPSVSSSSHGAQSYSGSASSQLGLSAADHEKLLSGTPIYLTPKGLGGHSNIESLISQGQHGSPSLSGNYNYPSAGHSAPAISFGQLLGGHGAPSSSYGAPSGSYGAPSSSYGVPTLAHGSSGSDYLTSSSSHGDSTPSFGNHIGGAGYSTEENDSEGYGHQSGNAGQVTGFTTSTIHGSPDGHGSASSYAAPSSSYGAPSYASSGGDYSGASGSYEGIGGGKLELPYASASHAFSQSSHDSPSSSYSAPSQSFSSLSGSYGVPHETYGPPQGSYSLSEDSQHAQSESNYNTIKYSQNLPAKELKKRNM